MKKIKIKKKVVIPVVILLIILAFAGYSVTTSANAPQIQTVDTYAAEVADLENTISVTGTVKSENTTNIYSSLSYAIEKVNVEVGDVVSEGDVLCQLDTDDLEATIRQNQASVWAAQQKANHSLAVAQKDLETAKFNVEGDYDTAILSAEAQVKSAENSLLTAENSLRSAESKVSDRRKTIRDLRDDKLQVDDDETYDDRITSEKQSLVQEEISLEDAQLHVEQARQTLEDAKANLRAVKMQNQEAQVDSSDAVTAAKLNTNFSDQYIMIEKLQQEMGKATVTSPVSGTVTAVYATEGAAGTGLLFVIEDTKNLKVETTVKEFDIGEIKEGLPVSIKTDGTGDEEFKGTVSKILPTAKKDASGNTVESNNAEFPAEVKVNAGSGLRIGMNARMKIITEQKKSVLQVPFEAVLEDEEGETSVFILVENEDGTASAKKIVVETGMETDFFSEITSSELKEGDKVILNPAGLEDGMPVAEMGDEAFQAMMA